MATLLPCLLTIQSLTAQEYKLPENIEEVDKTFILEKLAALNGEFLDDEPGGFETANIYWPPDSAFRIIHFEGESCGAYCNPYNLGYIVPRGEAPNDSIEFDIDPVTNIYYIDLSVQRVYLVFQGQWYRPRGIEGAYQLRVDAVGADLKPAKIFQTTNYNGDTTWSSFITASTSTFTQDDPVLEFDEDSWEIRYEYSEYAEDEFFSTGDFERIKGAYRFVYGRFLPIKETREAKHTDDH